MIVFMMSRASRHGVGYRAAAVSLQTTLTRRAQGSKSNVFFFPPPRLFSSLDSSSSENKEDHNDEGGRGEGENDESIKTRHQSLHDSNWFKILQRYEKQLRLERQQGETDEKRAANHHNHRHQPLVPGDDPSIISWIRFNRRKYQQGELSQEKLESLQETLQRVGAVAVPPVDEGCSTEAKAVEAVVAPLLDPRQAYWTSMWHQLRTFVKDHNGKKFPYDFSYSELESDKDKRLYYWCQRQKKDYKAFQQQQEKEKDGSSTSKSSSSSSSSRMTRERIRLLEEVGFVWDARGHYWMQRYNELVAYQKHHGDCLVPTDYPANPQLANWVSDQRTKYNTMMRRRKRQKQKQQEQHQQHRSSTDDDATGGGDDDENRNAVVVSSSLTPQRVALLQELDFCWNALDAKWMKRYKELEEHIRINNSSSSSSRSTVPPTLQAGSLKRWLKVQKGQYKRFLLEQEERSLSSSSNEQENEPQQEEAMTPKHMPLEQRFELLRKLGFPWE